MVIAILSGVLMKQSMLIFSVALNGYQWIYRDHLASQKAYAKRIGANYQVVTKPLISRSGVECCWYKLYLLVQAIQSGYQHVLFLDADCFVQPDCPDIREQCVDKNSIYMAKGYSQRFNSGVILVKGDSQALGFFNMVLASRQNTLLKKDSVGWGENGYIIACARVCQFIGVLSNKWNNTYDIELNDYIRHENFGPLRQNLALNLCHKLFNRLTLIATKIQIKLLNMTKCEFYQKSAKKELKIILKKYPAFSHLF
jgi:hypothetical protein